MVLEMSGHEVTLAHTGSAAIEKVRAAKPQVVLLDIGLPEIDGYEGARRVRAESSKPPVLVAMTGYGQEADKEQARAAGFDHHLVKPANIGDIESILETVF
jgi:CheY-like chemotaxis protein